MLTQKILKTHLFYNEFTGTFKWISRKHKKNAGRVLITNQGKRYIQISIDKHIYYAHRLAFLYMNNKWPENEIDHIDHDGENNTWTNLRDVTKLENAKNRKLNKTNTSGTTGVTFITQKSKYKEKITEYKYWRAQIKINSKQITIGNFKTKKEAIAARKKAEIANRFHRNHGEQKWTYSK